MIHKSLLIFLPLLVVGACSGTTTNTDYISKNANTTVQNGWTYTLSEVAQHNQQTDCWMAINGNVYDVTPSTTSGKHPGGDTILEGCGKDATTLFETRPMGSGTPHSDKAKGFLENMKIGKLQS